MRVPCSTDVRPPTRATAMANPETGADDFLAGFIDDYFAECDEHLTTIRRLLAGADPTLPEGMPGETLEELFRAFHSIKGLSGMVDLRDAEVLAHHMESYLRLLRGRQSVFTAEGLYALISGTSLLERVIAARRAGTEPPLIRDVAASLEALSSSHSPVINPGVRAPGGDEDAAGLSWYVVFSPSPALAARGI